MALVACPILMQDPQEILRSVWGYAGFRPRQEEIVRSVMAGNDTVALLPTGGGKSLCYQVPALAMEGTCIVISPLIALMQDQVSRLKQLGVKAEAVHSGKSAYDVDRILDNCIYGNIKILYLAPERLQSDLTAERLKRMKISMIAVDEAHCISQWGYDFRPSYLEIPVVREWHPDVPVLAVTATATARVLDDIKIKLDLRAPQVHTLSFARSNLSLQVFRTERKLKHLIGFLKEVNACTLVYVRSRKKTREIAIELSRAGVQAEAYHAGMRSEERAAVQKRWQTDQTPVIVCTTAFGMGIDKADVRAVVHYDLPGSLEEYYQEAGRAGRDGEESTCLMLYNESDTRRLKAGFHDSYPSPQRVELVYRALGTHANIAPGYGAGQSFFLDLGTFASHFKLPMALVYHSLKVLERDGWIVMSDAFYNPPKVYCKAERNVVFQYEEDNPAAGEVLQAILRSYSGVFLEPVRISPVHIAKSTGQEVNEVKQILEQLSNDDIIDYTPAEDLPRVTYLRPRAAKSTFELDRPLLEKLKTNALQRLESVLKYLDCETCRQTEILEYFDESGPLVPCGKCDLCTRQSDSPTREALLDAIGDGPVSIDSLAVLFARTAEPVIASLLHDLAMEEVIVIEDRIVSRKTKRTG